MTLVSALVLQVTNLSFRMCTTSGRTLHLRDNDRTYINSIECTDTFNNAVPPLPKKKQLHRILSQKTSANLTCVKEEHEDRSCSIAKTDPLQLEHMEEQTGSGVFQMTRMKVFCTDILNYGYLTPADPPTYNECPVSDTIPTSSYTSDKMILRLATGTGFESTGEPRKVNGSASMPVSLTSLLSVSRLSAQYALPYEDIDHYNTIHEDQHDPSIRHPFQSSTAGGLNDTTHTNLQFSAHNVTDASGTCNRQGRASCWVVVSLIVILIVSLTALSLSLSHLVSRSAKPRPIPQDLKQTLSKLELTVNNLKQENKAFKETLWTQETHVTFLTEDKISPVWTRLQNLSLVMESISDKYEAQIANTSLSPGPQGEPGVANLSLCLRQSTTTSASASATAATETSLLPSLTDIQEYFVTFAYCTYSGATDVNLGTQRDNTTHRQRYLCKCWGQVPGVNQTLCSIFIWMCPWE